MTPPGHQLKCAAHRYMVPFSPRTYPTLDRSTLSRTWLALLLVTGLTGCQQAPTKAPVEEATPAPVPPPPVAVPDIDELLDRAETAFREERLLGGPNHAHALYRQVLKVEPDNPDALYGIERITEEFIQRAREAIFRERWTVARLLLEQAARADQDHPSLPSTSMQLRQLRDAERLQLNLSRNALRGRWPETGEALARFGVHARKPNARVIIRAGSDAEGRWVYGRLNDAPGNRRIRGEILIGHPPRVVIFLLRETAP